MDSARPDVFTLKLQTLAPNCKSSATEDLAILCDKKKKKLQQRPEGK